VSLLSAGATAGRTKAMGGGSRVIPGLELPSAFAGVDTSPGCANAACTTATNSNAFKVNAFLFFIFFF